LPWQINNTFIIVLYLLKSSQTIDFTWFFENCNFRYFLIFS
jgi:hypothetical protein